MNEIARGASSGGGSRRARVWVVARDSGRAERRAACGNDAAGKTRAQREKERRGRSVGGVVHKYPLSHMRLIKVPPTTRSLTRIRRIRRTPTIVRRSRRAVDARAIPYERQVRGREKKSGNKFEHRCQRDSTGGVFAV